VGLNTFYRFVQALKSIRGYVTLMVFLVACNPIRSTALTLQSVEAVLLLHPQILAPAFVQDVCEFPVSVYK
jgi:hypothetical protein